MTGSCSKASNDLKKGRRLRFLFVLGSGGPAGP
jgi:hypothetical protein